MGLFKLDSSRLTLAELRSFVFNRENYTGVELGPALLQRVEDSYSNLREILESKKPVYGITTGLGDSCHRYVSPADSAELSLNLVRYLGCGTGALMSLEASRATMIIHLVAISRGYSAVSPALIERLRLFVENDWVPVIPREGSLGASGDLVPLSYLARALIGEADVYGPDGKIVAARELIASAGLAPYKLQAKEGLSLVNGVSTMAAQTLVNLQDAEFLLEIAQLSSAWLCLALGGRSEAFSPLIHERAKNQSGQARVAARVRELLAAEDYQTRSGSDTSVTNRETDEFIQDRYSLRCAPQVLGPVLETIELAWSWLDNEVNACSDNPLISPEGEMNMGGNFYGGYLSHSMDYLKISLANVADLLDRQLMLIVDDKSNRGLSPNLAAWSTMDKNEHHLHHGLKGLHQATSAITSEIMAKAIPNSIFSRSSESHNQDKVSLGMSGANQCADMIDQLYRVQTMHLVCLAQALDLRGRKLRGDFSRPLYEALRQRLPFVAKDAALGDSLAECEKELRKMARRNLEKV